MKVTVDLSAETYRAVKVQAARRDRKVRAIIDEALATWLEANDSAKDRASVETALIEYRRDGGVAATSFHDLPTPARAQYLGLPDAVAHLNLPFSEAVRVGDVLYLSGSIGIDATGALVPGGIEAETRQTLANIREVLERHGSSMDRVVKVTVMLADMAEWAAMNRVYAEHFPTKKPARSAFGTSGLALGARLELECVALAGE